MRGTPAIVGLGRRRVFAALLALVLLGVACDSDSDDAGDSETSESTTDAAAVLGEPNPATGEPFTIGFAVDTGSGAVETADSQTAAAAAADYVNEYLGGVGGRPLEIDFCETDNTAAGATACVNTFVQNGDSVVMSAVSGNGDSLATGAAEAGVPYVTLQGNSFPEFIEPNSFSLTGNAVGVLGAPIGPMQENDLTDLAILTIDVPAATQAVDAIARPAYEAAGINLELIPVAPGTADLSANVTSGSDADLWLVLGDTAFCTSALEALQVQVPDKDVYITQQCLSPDVADTLPNGYEGVTTIAATQLNPEDPDVEVFNAVLDTYAEGDTSDPGFLADGYSVVVGFSRLMETYSGDDSPESISMQLSTSTADLPLGGGVIIDCGNPPLTALSSVCSLGAWLTERDAAGEGVSFELVDVAPFISL